MGREYLGDLGFDGIVVFYWTLGKWGVCMWTSSEVEFLTLLGTEFQLLSLQPVTVAMWEDSKYKTLCSYDPKSAFCVGVNELKIFCEKQL